MIAPFTSSPRRRGSSVFNGLWTPAFAGVTGFGLFTRLSYLERGLKAGLVARMDVKYLKIAELERCVWCFKIVGMHPPFKARTLEADLADRQPPWEGIHMGTGRSAPM